MRLVGPPAALLLALGAGLGGSGRAEAQEGAPRGYLIVTRQLFAAAINDLAEYRRRGGYHVTTGLWETFTEDRRLAPRAAQVKAWIDNAARVSKVPIGAILICGDEADVEGSTAPWRIPAFRQEMYRWRAKQRTTFTSDSLYGDLDGDGLGDVPVGRLPVRIPEEVRAYVAKLRRYETMDYRADQLRTVLWLGIPGYDPRSDALMTPIAMEAVRRHLPSVLTAWWLSGDPSWPCWLPPKAQPKRFLAELAAGSVFSLFGGHGSATTAFANISKTARATMSIEDLRYLPAGAPTAPLVVLACTIGRIEFPNGPCLAEALWRHPGGPVAIVAATTESHPLTNYYSAIALAKTIGRRFGTVGEWWTEAQRVGFREYDPVIEAMLKDAEGKLEEHINVAKLRRDQPQMYLLLGDPACRLRLPEPVEVAARVDGGEVVISSKLPQAARRASVDVLRRPRWAIDVRGRVATSAPSAQEGAEFRHRLDEFNRVRLSTREVSVSPGRFEVRVALPAEVLRGKTRGIVRLAVFGEGGRMWAGVAEISIGDSRASR